MSLLICLHIAIDLLISSIIIKKNVENYGIEKIYILFLQVLYNHVKSDVMFSKFLSFKLNVY